MTVVLTLAPEATLHCRFAISPVSETTDALRALTHPGRERYHHAWRDRVGGALPALELGPLLALLPPGSYAPDFLAPPPAGAQTDVMTELRRIRSTPPEQVRAEVARTLALHPQRAVVVSAHPELSREPACVRDLLADLVERAWANLVEPWWPQIRDVLDADINMRARQLADHGTAKTLNALHPDITWRELALRIAIRPEHHRTLSDDGIVLMPSVFAWPAVGVVLDPPWQPTVFYPAHGIARLWQPNPLPSEELAQLIGRTRAIILSALSEPASTTGVAARCELAVSTVSEHLTVLRNAGLATTTRTGRVVNHKRTALGDELARRS